MRKMGGLRKQIPATYWMMMIGTLALTGVGIPGTLFGTAGFFSKDAIIESAFVGHNPAAGFAFGLLVIAALFTSFYSWRLVFMTFHGKPRASADVMHHVHESPPVMLIPLVVSWPSGRCSRASSSMSCSSAMPPSMWKAGTTSSGAARSSPDPTTISWPSSTMYRPG
jgi:hypothetical protein